MLPLSGEECAGGQVLRQLSEIYRHRASWEDSSMVHSMEILQLSSWRHVFAIAQLDSVNPSFYFLHTS